MLPVKFLLVSLSIRNTSVVKARFKSLSALSSLSVQMSGV